jgi:peptidoglycan/LPS O-acetylase OafA/YrhL
MSKSSLALSNLRAVVILIVLAFHASLAYLVSTPTPSSAFDRAPYQWQAFPIADAHRWLGFDVFCAWQDVSLMSLMFFLSGLLASGSLMRRGARAYIANRLWRIGVPFALAVIFLSPLAFYPAYLVRTAAPSFGDFWDQWFSLPSWPSGPEWFLWQLLALNMIAAGLYALAPGYIERLRGLAAWAGNRPIKFFVLLVGVSAVGYVPLAFAFSPWTWHAVGPFSLQLCRPLIYLTYFFAGFALGSYGLDRGLLAAEGPLARNWWQWLAAAAVSFAVWAGFTSLTLPHWSSASLTAQLGASLAFPIACAAGCLCLLAGSLRYSSRRSWLLDSLSANAYSMYLIHYVFVVWLQYALLSSGLIAAAKVAMVFTGAVIMSWTASAAFNRLVTSPQGMAVKRAVSPVPR